MKFQFDDNLKYIETEVKMIDFWQILVKNVFWELQCNKIKKILTNYKENNEKKLQ